MIRVNRKEARARRRKRVRVKVRGTTERPRLCVFRSARHIYAQIIDDQTGRTVVSASSMGKDFAEQKAGRGGNRAGASRVGRSVAERALAAGIRRVVFDRNGYLYHGRVQALSEGAREGGLEF